MTSSRSRELPNSPRVISQPTASNEIKIYCWNFRGIKAVGHISMLLSDGTYISHWPDKVLKSLLKRPATQMTFIDDIKLEGRVPEQVKSIQATNLDEDEIKRWWTQFMSDKGSKYNLISQNCAHIVSKAIQVGIVQQFHSKGKRLRKNALKMPMQTLKEILGLFKEWPKENYSKLAFHKRFSTSFEELCLAAEHFCAEINVCLNDNAEEKPYLDTFGVVTLFMNNSNGTLFMNGVTITITKLCKNIDNFTQEVTEAFEEMFNDPKPTHHHDHGRVVDDEEANDPPNPYPLELYSFISQLKEVKLYLGWSDAPHYSICDIMHRFGSGQLMQNIGLGNDDDFRSLATVLNPKFEFTTKVSQLYDALDFETVELFSEFCGRFPALTSLWMIWSPDMITFTQLVNSLASLAQLTHLYLDIDFEDQAENVFALVDRVDGEERQISVLPRFKVLELSIEKRSHDDFESLSSLVFPSVEVIIMGFSIPKHFSPQCVICRPDTLDVNGEDVDTIDRCHRLMILSLKSKFTNNNLRLYAERGHGRDYKDWTDYVRTEEDALPVIGDDDGQVDEQPKVVEA